MVKEEKFIETKVTYPLELEGELILITGVPARVNPETGTQFFSGNGGTVTTNRMEATHPQSLGASTC